MAVWRCLVVTPTSDMAWASVFQWLNRIRQRSPLTTLQACTPSHRQTTSTKQLHLNEAEAESHTCSLETHTYCYNLNLKVKHPLTGSPSVLAVLVGWSCTLLSVLWQGKLWVKEACCVCRFATPGFSFLMLCGHWKASPGTYFAVLKKQNLKPFNKKQMDIHRQSHLCISAFSFSPQL